MTVTIELIATFLHIPRFLLVIDRQSMIAEATPIAYCVGPLTNAVSATINNAVELGRSDTFG